MTGAESLSLGTQPVTKIPSTLSLSGRCGVSPQKGAAETLARPWGKAFPFKIIFRPVRPNSRCIRGRASDVLA